VLSIPMPATPDLLENERLEKPTGYSPRQILVVVFSVILSLLSVIGLVIWGIYQVQVADPYIRDVLALQGDPVRGESIFRQNCATCHGLEASGEVGPDLHGVSARKSRIGLIKQVTSGQTPPMPQFQPNTRDMADLLAFLETL
jgi:mono/diheme cytochrome c family protein